MNLDPQILPKVKKRRKFSKKTIVVILILIAAVAVTVYFYRENNRLKTDPSAITELQNKEVEDLTAKIGKLIELPSGETPVVATVDDKEKLKEQPFFKNAENGDKILIYTTAKKAVVYRPATDKIINVGPIAVSDAAEQSAQ